MTGQQERPGTLAAAGEDVIVNCERCDSANFRIMYDARIGGYHAECAKCGEVFYGLR